MEGQSKSLAQFRVGRAMLQQGTALCMVGIFLASLCPAPLLAKGLPTVITRLSGLPSPLWVVQGTVSDCLQRKGRLVCVCASSDEAMSIFQVREVTYLIHFQPWHLCPRATLTCWPGAFLLHPCPPYLPTGHLWLYKGAMRTSAFSFPLRLHFYLIFSVFDFQSLVLVIQQD